MWTEFARTRRSSAWTKRSRRGKRCSVACGRGAFPSSAPLLARISRPPLPRGKNKTPVLLRNILFRATWHASKGRKSPEKRPRERRGGGGRGGEKARLGALVEGRFEQEHNAELYRQTSLVRNALLNRAKRQRWQQVAQLYSPHSSRARSRAAIPFRMPAGRR